MKMMFRGWSREVFSHKHEVKPTVPDGHGYRIIAEPEAVITKDGTKISGKISDLRLSGDFRVDLTLTEADVRSLVLARVKRDPVDCVEWLGKLHAEALASALRVNQTEISTARVAS